jgi:septum site-determining protein MinC
MPSLSSPAGVFEDGGNDARDLFVTETMAELSARQGRIADAIAIYRQLLAAGATGDRRARWELRLAALSGAAVTGVTGAAGRETAVVPASSTVRETESPAPTPTAVAPSLPVAPAVLRMPLVIDRPVRSGQIVYAEARDLVVLAPVNTGAQLMADGHIHVYAPLRGRAVAGVRGAAEAQIFCQRLEAELVGVDAAYIAADDLPVQLWGGPARIWLEGGVCRLARLPGAG